MITIIPALKEFNNSSIDYTMDLDGKPLIFYSIVEAQKSKYISKVIVSTDNNEIARLSKEAGAEVFYHESNELFVSKFDLYLKIFDAIGEGNKTHFGDFIVLDPLFPLRTVEDIDNSIQTFRNNKGDSLISVCQSDHSPENTKKIEGNRIFDYFAESSKYENRRVDEISYLPNNAISILKYSIIKKQKTAYSDNTIPYVMNFERALDISSQEGVAFSKALLKVRADQYNKIKELENYVVDSSATIKEAIKLLNNGGIGFICVVDNNQKVRGIITDGDFRRAVLNEVDINLNVNEIVNSKYIFLEKGYKDSDLRRILENRTIYHIPVLDNGSLIEIISIGDLPKVKKEERLPSLSKHPVVIMAGGFGTRMQPFTNILPKPLIPIGDKSLLEVIIEGFARYDVNEYYISVFHKAGIIKSFIQERNYDFDIDYIYEDKPLGTAGALKYIENKINETFFVSNCDIIIKDDYSKMMDFHKKGGYQLTLIASMQHHSIPYGVCKIKSGGELQEITEKPEYDILVNTGMYVLEPSVLKYIPEGEFFHITHLINELLKQGIKVGVYPVSEGAWLDLGQIEEYRKSLDKLEQFDKPVNRF